MLRATLKSLLSRKTRLLLSGLAVILGVTFVSGAFILTDTLGRSFDKLFATAYADTHVVVTPHAPLEDTAAAASGTLDDTTIHAINAIPGVSQATGTVTAPGARLVGANGKVVPSVGPPRLGTSWNNDRTGLLRTGRGPTAANEIAINAALATTAGVHVGDTVNVLTLQPAKPFTLVGIFGYANGQDSLGGAQMIAFTEPVAQQLILGHTGLYSAIDVNPTPGTSDDTLRDRIATTLGATYTVKTGKQLADESTASITEALTFFNYILLGFAGVSLFVGIFIILNTFSIIVAQRTKELALMRAIGASRRQMIGSVLLEAAIIGITASIVGLAAGLGIGTLLAKVFGSFGSGNLPLADIALPTNAIISALTVGIGITMIAALVPALRASRIPPIAAMRDAATPDRPMTTLLITGAITTTLGATLLTLGLTGNAGNNTLWAILGGVLLAFIGTALLTPLLARPVSGLVGRLFAWSVPGKLGRLNSGRNPRRTAITAAALMVGIALIIGITTVISSAKQSFTNTANQKAHVDLIISGDPGPEGEPTFEPAVLDKIAHISDVRAVVGLYRGPARVNNATTYVSVMTNMAAVPAMFSLTTTSGVIDTVHDGQIVVDETTATDNKLALGSDITVQLPKGEAIHLTVSGIYAKNDLFSGYLLPQSTVTNFSRPQPNQAYIQVRQSDRTTTVKNQIDTLLKDSPEVSVGDRAEYLAQQSQNSDTVLNMIQLLLLLAIIIAVLGVINTLALSVLERTRELGLLRAVGLNRAQTMRMVTVEAVVISLFGALLGLAVGAGLGAAVVKALKDKGITVLALPWGQMATYLVVAAIVGVVAAVVPAIRAARINVLQAIAYE